MPSPSALPPELRELLFHGHRLAPPPAEKPTPIITAERFHEEVEPKVPELMKLHDLQVDPETAAAELQAIEEEMRRRRWRGNLELWAQERMGETLWSGQRKILRSVSQNRRTAVQSCHEIGKSYSAALVVAGWLDIWPPGEAFVVTSAPSGPQVKAILWREINKAHSRGGLSGRVNQTEWYMELEGGNEALVAFGRKPDEYDATAFQGIHARRVLYVFDEACGMPESLWEAADSLIANDYGKALAIGNPDDPGSEFRKICKPGSGWNVIKVSAFDSPNFTGEELPQRVKDELIGPIYVEEKRRKWAPTWRWTDDGKRVEPPAGVDPTQTHPFWQSKVLGEFPARNEAGALIPIAWVEAAQQRTLEPSGPWELGVDVGAGGDSSVIALRKGSVVRIISEDQNPNTMETCGNVLTALEQTQADQAKVDSIGIGKGIVDRGLELEKPFVPVHVGVAADDPKHYINRRAELYWHLRELFETGDIDIDPEDDDLAAELVEIRYRRLSNGKIQIESKKEMKERGMPSPNRAEAVMLAVSPAPAVEVEGGVLAGKCTW